MPSPPSACLAHPFKPLSPGPLASLEEMADLVTLAIVLVACFAWKNMELRRQLAAWLCSPPVDAAQLRAAQNTVDPPAFSHQAPLLPGLRRRRRRNARVYTGQKPVRVSNHATKTHPQLSQNFNATQSGKRGTFYCTACNRRSLLSSVKNAYQGKF